MRLAATADQRHDTGHLAPRDVALQHVVHTGQPRLAELAHDASPQKARSRSIVVVQPPIWLSRTATSWNSVCHRVRRVPPAASAKVRLTTVSGSTVPLP